MTNPLFNNDWLITDTGAVDWEFIKVSAEARAKSMYGATCKPADIEYWTEKLTSLAGAMAQQFAAGKIVRASRYERAA